MQNNGIINTKQSVTITIYPSEEGFGCTVVEPKELPLSPEFGVALTIAHGMVKIALEQPDIVFDAGVESLSNPIESDTVVSIADMVNRKKGKLH